MRCGASWQSINECLHIVDSILGEVRSIEVNNPDIEKISEQTFVDGFNSALTNGEMSDWRVNMVVNQIVSLRLSPWVETYNKTRSLIDRFLVEERSSSTNCAVGSADTGLVMYSNQSKDTQICRFWYQFGNCNKGNKCNFFHGVQRDIRNPKDKCEIKVVNYQIPNSPKRKNEINDERNSPGKKKVKRGQNSAGRNQAIVNFIEEKDNEIFDV